MPPAADDASTAHEQRYNKSPVYASEPMERHGLSKVEQFRYHATCKHSAAVRAGEARGALPHTNLENSVQSLAVRPLRGILEAYWICSPNRSGPRSVPRPTLRGRHGACRQE